MMADHKVVAIIQTRMGSSRLPGKALSLVSGQPLLALIVKRILPSKYIDQLVVATTKLSHDDAIEVLANELNVPCFRGSEEDCLDRYYQAAKKYKADIIVRLTGDNPLIDSGFVDWMMEQYLSADPPYDYIDSALSKSFPVGLSVEIFSFLALTNAWKEETNMQWREHVTPFIYRHTDLYRVKRLVSPVNYSHMRWTMDTPQDLNFVRRVFEYFGHDQFSWRDVIAALEQHPEWLEINRYVEQKAI
jgi:spore coat polysaccharide biosynthesis protein SpsF